MSSVNKVTLIGRLGADPEVRYTQGGQPVANLRVATSENWTDRDGQRQERTEWHSVSVWGKQAELCGQYLSKGRQVYLEGRIQSREYTDKEGINRKAVDIVASQVVFLGGRQEGSGGQWGANQNSGWGSAPQKSEQSSGWGQNQGGGGGGGGWGQNQGGGGGGGGWGQNQGGSGGGWGQNQGGGAGGGSWGQTSSGQSNAQDNAAPTNNDDDPIPF